jgi:hypothetical protein
MQILATAMTRSLRAKIAAPGHNRRRRYRQRGDAVLKVGQRLNRIARRRAVVPQLDLLVVRRRRDDGRVRVEFDGVYPLYGHALGRSTSAEKRKRAKDQISEMHNLAVSAHRQKSTPS